MNNKFSKLAIVVIILLSALSFIPLSNLKFDFNLEQFFPINDPDLDFFNAHKSRFISQIEDEYIFIGLTSEKGVFNKEFLDKVDELTNYIIDTDSIISVYSITNSTYHYFNKNGRQYEIPVIRLFEPEYLKEDSIKLNQSAELKEFLLSKDGKSVAVSAFNTPNLTDKAKEDLLKNIKGKIDQLGFNKSYFTAKILVEETYVKEIQSNLIIYLSISLFLICVLLFFLYRSFKGIIIPLITILFSISWTLALISIFGYSLDIISSLLPPVLAVICMSDIIHIYTKYIEELRNGEEKITALKHTFRDIGKATFYTSLTTAIGFYSLSFSNIVPIRTFGIFAGTGVLLTYLLVIVFIFSVNINSPIPKIVNFHKYENRWTKFLSAALRQLFKKRYWITGSIVFLLIISTFFIYKIQINSSLLQEIPKDNPILEDYNFVETQFSGARAFEMALILKDPKSSFLDIEVVKEVEDASKFLKDSCGVGMLISHLSFIKGARKAFSGEQNADYNIPETESEVYYLANQIMLSEWGDDLIRYMTIDRKHSRISGKLPDLTTIEFNALTKKFDNYIKSKKDIHFNYKMTGSGVLIDKTTYSLTKNMIIGLLIAFIVISIIVGFMFRSFRMILIVLIANIIPLIFMAAIMEILGIYLKADTSIIFAVSFGIVVDDSIHYLSKLRIELSKGKSIIYAIKRSYLSTGKAIILTTVLLLAGFVPLLFSSFGGTYYIGLLVSLCLIFAVIIDLTLLPLMILGFYKKRN